MNRYLCAVVVGHLISVMLPTVSVGAAADAGGRVAFVVAPDGNDDHPGTLEKPFATFEQARDAVNAAKASAPPGEPIVVEFRGGRYFLSLPVTLLKRDSGTKNRPVIFRAYGDEKPIFYGGKTIMNFTPAADMPGTFVAELAPVGLRAVSLSTLFRVLPDGNVERLQRSPPDGGGSPEPRPGEWVCDEATGRLFVRPPQGVPIEGFTVILSKGRSILTLLRGVEYVTIMGLAFRGCEGSAVVLSQTARCTIDRCTIDQVGDEHGTGIVVDMGEGNVISGCRVSHTGGHGIVVDGGHHVHRREFSVAANRVVDSVVEFPGDVLGQGNGIATTGMGNEIVGNCVRDCPRAGIMVGGNRHMIERNLVQRTNRQADNSAAIFVAGRDFLAGRGTVIRHNLIEDTGGRRREGDGQWVDDASTCGVLLDVHASGADVVGNVIVRAAAAGIRLENGRNNRITDNLLCGSGDAPAIVRLSWPADDSRWDRDFTAVGYTFEQAVTDAKWTAWRSLRGMDRPPRDVFAQHGTTSIDNTIEHNEVASTCPDFATLLDRGIPTSFGGVSWRPFTR